MVMEVNKKKSIYRVRLAFGNYKVGRIVEPPGMLRDDWIRRGLIEEVPQPEVVEAGKDEYQDADDDAVIETATIEEDTATETAQAPRRGRGRPRKNAI